MHFVANFMSLTFQLFFLSRKGTIFLVVFGKVYNESTRHDIIVLEVMGKTKTRYLEDSQ